MLGPFDFLCTDKKHLAKCYYVPQKKVIQTWNNMRVNKQVLICG